MIWLRRNDKFLLDWLHDFKVWFLSNFHCDSAVCKWKYQKKLSKIQNHFLRKLFSFLLFLFAGSKPLQKQSRDNVLKSGFNQDFAKLKRKSLIRIKSCALHRNFSSFPKSLTIVVFKNEYGHKVMKILNIEAIVLRYYDKYCYSIGKLRGKSSTVEFNFIKFVRQKLFTVINMELFLNIFWSYWTGWRLEVNNILWSMVHNQTWSTL